MFIRKIREAFHPVHQFRPCNLYRITTKDDNHVITIKDGKMILTVLGNANYEKTLFYIDSDIGTITLFDDLDPYINITEANELVHKSDMNNISYFYFDDNGIIRKKNDHKFCIGGNIDTGSVTMIDSTKIPDKTIIEWKFVLAHDTRQFYYDTKKIMMQSELENTTASTIQDLKELNDAYLRRADAEINHRDKIITNYEEQWFIKTFINGGKLPSSKMISERTFARPVQAQTESAPASSEPAPAEPAPAEAFTLPRLGMKNRNRRMKR